MSTHVDRVKLDEVDWQNILPWLRLFRCFRSAVHPAKLLTAWLFVVLLFAIASLLSYAADDVQPGEIDVFRRVHADTMSDGEFTKWREETAKRLREQITPRLKSLADDGLLPPALAEAESDAKFYDEAATFVHEHYLAAYEKAVAAEDDDATLEKIRESRREALATLSQRQAKPVFKAAFEFKVAALDRLCRAAVSWEWGFDELFGATSGAPSNAAVMPQSESVVGALRDMLIILPSWLWQAHPWFLVFYLIAAWLLWSYFGGALSRMTAMQAARQSRISLTDGRRYVHRNLGSYLFSPLAPAFVIGFLSLVMVIAGVVLFSWILDVVGGAFFFLALFGGFALAFAMLIMVGGLQMFYPAIAYEGAGIFDAVSRGASYVLNRPWRWVFYSMVATVYGAVTYLFLGFVLFLTLWMTHRVVGQWVIADQLFGIDRFNDLMPMPTLSDPTPSVDYQALNGTGAVSAWLIRFWVLGLVALLFAYGISFYSCAQSWIYALLRRSVDGVGLDDITDAEGEMPEAAPDKIEPDVPATE